MMAIDAGSGANDVTLSFWAATTDPTQATATQITTPTVSLLSVLCPLYLMCLLCNATQSLPFAASAPARPVQVPTLPTCPALPARHSQQWGLNWLVPSAAHPLPANTSTSACLHCMRTSAPLLHPPLLLPPADVRPCCGGHRGWRAGGWQAHHRHRPVPGPLLLCD